MSINRWFVPVIRERFAMNLRHSGSAVLMFTLLATTLGCMSGPYGDSHWHRAFSRYRDEDEPTKLLEWAVGHKKPEDDKDNEKDEKDGKNGNGKNGNGKDGKNGKNGNGENGKTMTLTGPDQIATDRPDFVEASVAVGRGRVQLESGYTYIQDRADGKKVVRHSYPEALLRIGMFADWFELRIGQNLGGEFDSAVHGSVHGGEDLYLGMRFDLTEQKGVLPEMSLIFQTLVPTGHSAFTAKQMLPGFNLLYGWDIVEDKWTLGASTQLNRRVDDSSHFYAEFAQAFTLGHKWTPRLGQYTEWFTLVPCGAITEARTEHYLDGGFTYLITDNFQVDIRAGMGLNRAANDFFAGSGFGVRY